MDGVSMMAAKLHQFWSWLACLGWAMEGSDDPLLSRRVSMLEQDLSELRTASGEPK